jgi:hypothetical protein
MPVNYAGLTPKRSRYTVLATVSWHWYLTSSAKTVERPTSLQNHAFVEILIPVLDPGVQRNILYVAR